VDDDDVREIASMMLEGRGFDLVAVPEAFATFAVLEANGIDTLPTDI